MVARTRAPKPLKLPEITEFKEGLPVARGRLTDRVRSCPWNAHLEIVCPLCGRIHHHGWDTREGFDVITHRVPHCCDPYIKQIPEDAYEAGYYVAIDPKATHNIGLAPRLCIPQHAGPGAQPDPFNWNGDIETNCWLHIGQWFCRVERIGTFEAILGPDHRDELGYWSVVIIKDDEEFFRSTEHPGFITSAELGRELCERTITAWRNNGPHPMANP